MSVAARGRVISIETRRKLSAAQSGKRASPEARNKMAAAATGRVASQETVEKLSKAHKGRPKGGRNVRGVNNGHAKWWHLKSPDGVTYRFKNLLEFVRNGSENGVPADDLTAPLFRSRAYAGLASLHPGRRQPQGSWKGWTWVFSPELLDHLHQINT